MQKGDQIISSLYLEVQYCKKERKNYKLIRLHRLKANNIAKANNLQHITL